jgi:hypothetical protein
MRNHEILIRLNEMIEAFLARPFYEQAILDPLCTARRALIRAIELHEEGEKAQQQYKEAKLKDTFKFNGEMDFS